MAFMFASLSTGREMGAGWIKTKDRFGSAFEAVQQESDWLLVSGQLVVGRVCATAQGRKLVAIPGH
jgi:hypothetical protein